MEQHVEPKTIRMRSVRQHEPAILVTVDSQRLKEMEPETFRQATFLEHLRVTSPVARLDVEQVQDRRQSRIRHVSR